MAVCGRIIWASGIKRCNQEQGHQGACAYVEKTTGQVIRHVFRADNQNPGANKCYICGMGKVHPYHT